MSDQSQYIAPPEVERFDATTGEHTNRGVTMDAALSVSNRHDVRRAREDEWERFCAAHKGDGSVAQRVRRELEMEGVL